MIALASMLGLASAADLEVLMVGNSYTSSNGLSGMVDELLEGGTTWPDVEVVPVTSGGKTLTGHLADADGTNGATALREALVESGTPWHYVTLQEQSQTPGFDPGGSTWQGSLDAAVGLNQIVTENGAQTLFFLTWGRRSGDNQNPEIYPDFSTMQDRLTDGYLAYIDACTTTDRPVYAAPVGLAFQAIHDDLVAQGQDPLDPQSDFWTLYSADGSHPSRMGSFLAASTFYAAITGRQPGTLDSQVDAGLSLADQERLIDVAASVVLDEPFGRFDWPWVFQWEDWGSETIHGDDIRPLVSIEEEVLADQVQVQDGRLWLRRDGSLTATELSVSSQSEFVWKKGTLSVTRFVGDLQVPEDGILEIPDTTQVEGSMGGIGIVRYDGPTDGRRQVLTADALDLSGATIEVPQDTTWWIEGQALWVGDPSEGPSTESTEGCGCRSAAGGPAGGGWMVLGLAVLLWGRLTRRSWE